MKYITLRMVAEKAKVSVNTASRAINNRPDINLETKKRVLQIAKELGYIRNGAAVALRTKKTGTVGVVIEDNRNPFYAEVLNGMEVAAREKNYHIIFANTQRDYKKEEEAINLLLAKRVDGLLIAPVQDRDDDIKNLIEANIPFVIVGRDFENIELDAVYNDEVKGGFLATEYLIKKGHKRIALIDGFLYKSPAKGRLEGYKKALKKYGISMDDALVSVGDIDVKDGYERTKQLFEKELDFTAIFAYNDMMAFGAMQAIREKGLIIPEDIGLVGYDDIPFCALMDPALTTIRLKKQELGIESLKLLLSRINSNRKKAKKIMLDVDIIVRKT
ncbi:MAG: LacI family transcriptional regulator [Actinobacteria bacterium RBG_13_35_12]|uniref:LacI family transcriptional regulator n=1 Tax=Candidatus Sediminicultor quintus TaxID=1797291 RepID=A0A1F5A590_9BACT|nr:MAG: LacI family transcriptional regulator [Actinobacteria bacterium RBG_13_35_12]OGD13723.1 MAG: LacI family transcriptional regulator [Candidatus Atribacteria bacterium RBG_19FT_COMBO_35_14]